MQAIGKIGLKKNEILYKKVGRKFVPVNDPWAKEGLSEGWWLIKVEPNCTTIRQCVFPDRAELEAAMLDKQEEIVNVIRKACEARPNKTPLNPDEQRDWDWFIKKHGESFNTLRYPSFQQNAEEILNVLTGRKKK